MEFSNSLITPLYREISPPRNANPSFKETLHELLRGTRTTIIRDPALNNTLADERAILDLIIEWVKKSPPEVIPHLMNMAFEMSDLPNKETLLAKIKPLLGADPYEDELPPEELKQKVQAELEAQQKEAAQQAEIEKLAIQLELEQKRLENEELKAKVQKLLAEAGKTISDAQLEEEKVELDAIKTGADVINAMKPDKGGNGDKGKERTAQ